MPLGEARRGVEVERAPRVGICARERAKVAVDGVLAVDERLAPIERPPEVVDALRVAAGPAESIARSDGLAETTIATAPAPCVGSPAERRS